MSSAGGLFWSAHGLRGSLACPLLVSAGLADIKMSERVLFGMHH